MEELDLVIIGDKVWISSVELARVYNRKHYSIMSKINKIMDSDSTNILKKYIKKREFDIGGYYYIISCDGFAMIGGHFKPKLVGYTLISKMIDFKKENNSYKEARFSDVLLLAANKALLNN